MTILPLRRLYIERQIQPEMLNFTSKEEVITLFNMYVCFFAPVHFIQSHPRTRYFDNMNVRRNMRVSHLVVCLHSFWKMHCNVLDRGFHTPSLVCSRSPFLLTTSTPHSIIKLWPSTNKYRILVCAISSKFYGERPELHNLLTDLSRKLAFSVPEQGYKSIEIVQAYLLLALWGCGPAERFEQDKTWLLLGMGIRYLRSYFCSNRTSKLLVFRNSALR